MSGVRPGAQRRRKAKKKKKATARATAVRPPADPAARRAEAALRRRARRIAARFAREYEAAECALVHRNALELLVATILSAQCTDRRVNLVTPALFARYPDASAFAAADPEKLQKLIHSTGFFRNKTRSILGACRRIRDEYGGEVPDTMEDLLTLPGVARKTANVVLGTWFGKNEGVVVDTHVFRIAYRLGLTPRKNPAVTERRLMALLPRREWTDFSHRVILHGRAVCSARKPACRGCALERMCPKNGVEPEARARVAPARRGRRNHAARRRNR